MYPHVIRLRGPWEATRAASSGEKTTHRVTLPGHWSQLDAATDISLSRGFGRPRILDPEERVWLVWSNVSFPAELVLNAQPLASVQNGHGSQEITGRIEARNMLSVHHHRAGSATASLGEFALEIRGPVFLEDLRLESREGNRLISGKVTGEVKEKLELYVLIYGRTVSHQVIRAELGGVPFRMPCPDPSDGPVNPGFPRVRVELIEGATCWWRTDFSGESEIPLWPASASMPE